MKRLLATLLTVVIVFSLVATDAFVMSVHAASYDYFEYTVEDNEVTITRCDTEVSGELVIPSEIAGFPVTRIGDFAFYACSNLTNIKIPEGIVGIGDSAFSECSSLTSVEIPEGVVAIEGRTFFGCTSLKCVKLPENLTKIGHYAFKECSSLMTIEMQEGVESIGEEAFYGCKSLASIKIPECITDISYGLFHGCSGLTNVEIPKGVTSIGEYAFYGCCSLTSIEIPEGVTSIGKYGFSGCSGLTSIGIPKGVISIEWGTFSECSSLTSIDIPEGVTSIGNYVFSDSGLTSIKLPSTLQEIYEHAFSECRKLTDAYYNGTEGNWKNIVGKENLGNVTLHYLKIGVSGVELSLESKSLYEDGAFTLEAKVLPEDASNKTIFWETSDSNVATVNEGVVTAIAPGTAIITVLTEDGRKTATCKIEVLEYCETHLYGDWIKINDDKHSRNCLMCAVIEEKEHEWDSGNITEPASCMTEGTKTYKCNFCEATKTESIEELGHNLSEEWLLDKAPTDSEEGSKSRYCVRCDLAVETITIPQIECNHSNSGYREIESPTCTINGSWERKCYDCDMIIDSGEIPCEHSRGAWEMAKEPTCTEEGIWEIRCNDCDSVINSEIIPAHGHVYQYGYGYADREEGFLYMNLRCTYCGDVKSKRPISIHNHRGHAFSIHVEEEASCTERGWWKVYCITCMDTGYVTGLLDSYEFGVNGHDFDYYIKQVPTCTEDGYWESRCKNCALLGESGSIPALGHDEGYYTEIVSARCTQYGHWERKCNKCNAQIAYGLIPMTGHEYKYKEVEQATCASEGQWDIICEDCDVTIESINTKKVGHKYLEEWNRDNNGHWHECSACHMRKDEEKHIYDNTDNIMCNICGWYYGTCSSPTGEHTYSYDCDTDCDACGEIRVASEHNYESACDTTCDCGYERTITHNHQLSYNAQQHYLKCTVCGDKINEEPHVFENACDTTCDCGYERTITHNYQLSYNAQHHYLECTVCGDKKNKEAHVFENACDTTCDCGYVRTTTHNYLSQFDSIGHWEECFVCHAKRNVEQHTYSNACDTICDKCGHKNYILGDLDGNEEVTDADALYLLYNTIFGDSYPIRQYCDYNKDGLTTDADALYLLYHTVFGDSYPLN